MCWERWGGGLWYFPLVNQHLSRGGVRKKTLRWSGGGFKKIKGKNKEIIIAHPLDKLWMLPKVYIFQEFAEGLLSICFCWIFQNVHLSKVSVAVSHKVNLPSCVAWWPLCHKVNLQTCVAQRSLGYKGSLPRCEARWCRFIMTCDIFGTGKTNILGLCYSFGKTYKQPTVAPLKSLKSTYTLDQTTALIEMDHTISLAFKAFS